MNHYTPGHRKQLEDAGISGVGGTNFKWNKKNKGWRLAKTSLAQCKEACRLIGCAEMSVAKSGKTCFLAKTKCKGSGLGGWTKYHFNANSEQWITNAGSDWCGKSHNEGDYVGARDRIVLERFSLSGVAGSNFKLSKNGWRLAKASLAQCREACRLIGCAEMSVSSNGKTCFLAKTRCEGSGLGGWTKYVLNAPGCPSVDSLDCAAACASGERCLQLQRRAPLFAMPPSKSVKLRNGIKYAAENLDDDMGTEYAKARAAQGRCGCA